jgi:hypothetical protein
MKVIYTNNDYTVRAIADVKDMAEAISMDYKGEMLKAERIK